MKSIRSRIVFGAAALLLLSVLAGGIYLKVRGGIEYTGGEKFEDPRVVNAAHLGKSILVHMKSGLKPDDTQPCVAFNTALGLVRSGYKVSILIDARANADFMGHSPDKSKWGGYKLPAPMVRAVADELHIPLEEFPKTYMEYMKWLSDQGASVYMNATMNILSGEASTIRDQMGVPAFIKLLTFPEMAKLLAESDRYIAY